MILTGLNFVGNFSATELDRPEPVTRQDSCVARAVPKFSTRPVLPVTERVKGRCVCTGDHVIFSLEENAVCEKRVIGVIGAKATKLVACCTFRVYS